MSVVEVERLDSLPHMRYPGVWGLAHATHPGKEAVAYHDWVLEDDERVESLKKSLYRHKLGMISSNIGVEINPFTDEREKLVVANYYLAGIDGSGDLHNHLRSGVGKVAGSLRDSTIFHQEYYKPLPPGTKRTKGLEVVERQLVVNAIEQPDNPADPAEYHPHIVGTTLLHKLGESTLIGLGAHKYGTVFVHEISTNGPMLVSFLEKGPLESPELTTPAGLAIQGFAKEEIADVVDFKTKLEKRKGKSLVGISPVYMEDVPGSDEELSQLMQSDGGDQLTDSDRDALVKAIFSGHESMKKWVGKQAA